MAMECDAARRAAEGTLKQEPNTKGVLGTRLATSRSKDFIGDSSRRGFRSFWEHEINRFGRGVSKYAVFGPTPLEEHAGRSFWEHEINRFGRGVSNYAVFGPTPLRSGGGDGVRRGATRGRRHFKTRTQHKGSVGNKIGDQ